MRLAFRIDGKPLPLPRHRSAAFIPKGGGKPRTRTYADDRADPWMHATRSAFAAALRLSLDGRPAPLPLFRGPVRLSVEFVFSRPQSHLTSRGALTRGAPLAHTSKPDLSNFVKAIEDALCSWPKGAIALAWADDSCIVEIRAAKRWARSGEASHASVEIEAVELDAPLTRATSSATV